MSIRFPAGDDPVDESVTGSSIHRVAEELGDGGVRVELGEGRAVVVAPLTEHEPGGGQPRDRRLGHRVAQLGAARSRRGKTTRATPIATATTTATSANPATSTVPFRMSRDAR